MCILNKISNNGGHISWSRHAALKGVVYAISALELEKAHERVLNGLKEGNVWIALNEQGVMLSREWPEPPREALMCFPDQGTALQTLEETGVKASFNVVALSYKDALESSNKNNALLVMVTYDGMSPHDVPISYLSSGNWHMECKKAWWQFW